MALTKRKDRIIYPDLGVTAHARLWGVSRQRADQILNRPARHARQAVQRALKSGRVVKPKACERCQKGRRPLQAHHSDYARRLDVQWLCRKCHGIVHPHHPFAKNANPDPKQRYCSDCGKAIQSHNKGGRCEQCRMKHQSVTKACAECGTEFSFTASEYYRRAHGRQSMGVTHDRWFCWRGCASRYTRLREQGKRAA